MGMITTRASRLGFAFRNGPVLAYISIENIL